MLRTAKAAILCGLFCLSAAACSAPPRDPGLERSSRDRFDRYYVGRSSPFAPRGDLFDRP